MADNNYDWERFNQTEDDDSDESGDGLDEFRGEFLTAHIDRTQPQSVEDRFDPPQMTGLESPLQSVRETEAGIVRTYANGDTHTTVTTGQYAGSEYLQNRNGQIVSQLTTPGSEGQGMPRLRMDYTYDAAHNGLASSVRVTDARTGDVVREVSTPNGEGSIFASPIGLDIRWPAGAQIGPQSQHIRMDGLRMNEVGNERSMEFIAQQDMNDGAGLQIPRGTRVQHFSAKGNTFTSLTLPDGQIDRYMRNGGALRFTGSEFPRPRDMRYVVNGQNVNFPGVSQMWVDANNGDLVLSQANGLSSRLVHQNGAFTGVVVTKKDK